MEAKNILIQAKNPFKLNQNPVTQSNLKLQRETQYAVLGTLMHCQLPSCTVGHPHTLLDTPEVQMLGAIVS